MLDLMQQELDFSRGEALTLASLTVDLIRRPAFTYRSSSVPGKPRTHHLLAPRRHFYKIPSDLTRMATALKTSSRE